MFGQSFLWCVGSDVMSKDGRLGNFGLVRDIDRIDKLIANTKSIANTLECSEY